MIRNARNVLLSVYDRIPKRVNKICPTSKQFVSVFSTIYTLNQRRWYTSSVSVSENIKNYWAVVSVFGCCLRNPPFYTTNFWYRAMLTSDTSKIRSNQVEWWKSRNLPRFFRITTTVFCTHWILLNLFSCNWRDVRVLWKESFETKRGRMWMTSERYCVHLQNFPGVPAVSRQPVSRQQLASNSLQVAYLRNAFRKVNPFGLMQIKRQPVT